MQEDERKETCYMKRKNKTTQLIVVLILIFSLILLSICIAIYAAGDIGTEGTEPYPEETENMTQMSETEPDKESENTENMTKVSELQSDAENEIVNNMTQVSELQSDAENETASNMTKVSEIEDTQAYFTASVITEEIFQRINGCSYVENEDIALEDLRYLKVLHIGFDGEEHEGELIVNQAIADDILEIMEALYQNQYPIERMVLVDEYDGDDEKSMQANNTSCFNYRTVEGSSNLSKHSYGLAIDMNPFYNPCVRTYADGSSKSFPEGSDEYADRSKDFPYKIDRDDLCYQLFTEHGFRWGGTWNSLKDYQHFDKEIN